MSNPFTTKDQLVDIINQVVLGEKKLTDAELKKREEIAQAMERDNPGMDMGKKMAIATAQAKKVAEEVEIDEDDLSVRTLYNKYADRTANAKNTKPVEKAIKKVHGSKVLSHMKKAASANIDTKFDKEKQHFDKARKAAGNTDMIGATVGKNRSAFRKQYEEVEELDEAKGSTHENPLITVHKDGRLHAHLHLSTANDLHKTDVKHTQIHAGPVKVKTKYGDNLEYKLSKWHGVKEEAEQIDEVGNTLKGQIGLRDYKEKAKKDMGDAGEKLWYKSVSDKDTKGKMALIRQRDKRRKGIQRADARIKETSRRSRTD